MLYNNENLDIYSTSGVVEKEKGEKVELKQG
jgi:hypothetical protein